VTAALVAAAVAGSWGRPVVAGLLTGLAVAGLVAALHPPPRRLAARVRPYTAGTRVELGRTPDVPALGIRAHQRIGAGWLDGIVLPPLRALATWIGGRIDTSSTELLQLQLRQAGLLADIPDELRVQEFRVRQLGGAFAGLVVGTAAAFSLGLPNLYVLVVAGLGLTVGVTRWPSRLSRTLEDRRARMRIELYTVNQLLAVHVRAGGGAVQAAQRVVDRADGLVTEELAEALRAHASGLRAAEAFERAAATSAEPGVARLFRLLGSGTELGADLAEALRAQAADVRDARREALRRRATHRRAAMLVPIIAVLAPTMLLFIAAPIPSLVFGAR
jgi:tight adherence protein C